MTFYKGLVPLRDVLAELYPAPGLARTVVAEAGIPEMLVSFDGAAIEFWKNILATAQNNNQVRDLIDVACKHFPKNEKLIEAVKQYTITPISDSTYINKQEGRYGGVNFENSIVTVSGDIIGGNKSIIVRGNDV